MSFGDGNLHEKLESMRRSLGGAQANMARMGRRIKELERQNAALRKRVAELEGEDDLK